MFAKSMVCVFASARCNVRRHRYEIRALVYCSVGRQEARALNCIRHLLDQIAYKKLPREEVTLPDRLMDDAYDDIAALKSMRFVEGSVTRAKP
jgi:hypothetical protein